MKKVVCARCELVNLDTFPAFPLCEACGARLPSMRRFGWRGPLRRPILPLVWAIALGAGASMLTLLSVGLARDTRQQERGALVVSGQDAPDLHDPRVRIWTITLAPSDASDQEPLRFLRLRLSRKDERRWGFSVLSPRPTATRTLGGGRYFDWAVVPHGTPLRLRLLAPRPSGHRVDLLRLWWTADGFERLSLEVRSGMAGQVEPKRRIVQTKPSTGTP